jgi:hypothetical protein
MPEKSFKAATIVIPDAASRLALDAAFNDWSEETKPTSILHIHYYHDLEAHARGYQVVYEEPWMPYFQPDVPKEEETAHLLV